MHEPQPMPQPLQDHFQSKRLAVFLNLNPDGRIVLSFTHFLLPAFAADHL
jgi:hypothetical protein